MYLQIMKVNALPEVIEPMTLYFVKETIGDFCSIHISGVDNITLRRILSMSDVSAYVEGLKNQPNGLVGLDENGLANLIVSAIDGQNTSLMSGGGYVWEDLIAPFVVKNTSGANNPSFGPYMGNFQGYLFSASAMNQVWCDFHVLHDIAVGTKVFPHVHWLPTTNAAGVVRWGIEYTIAKGHGQEAFPTTMGTLYINHTVPANSMGIHMVSEVSEEEGILSTSIEPDTVIKTRIFRDGGNIIDTYNAEVHGWQADIHYQMAQLGTRNRAPNFFGA